MAHPVFNNRDLSSAGCLLSKTVSKAAKAETLEMKATVLLHSENTVCACVETICGTETHDECAT